MKSILVLFVSFHLVTQGLGCSPGSLLTICDSSEDSLNCGVKICKSSGDWQKLSSSTSSSSFSAHLLVNCQVGSHSTTCFKASSSTGDDFLCSRRLCDTLTGRWGSEAVDVAVEKTRTEGRKRVDQKVEEQGLGLGHSLGRGRMECIPGSFTKECMMIDGGLLECITQECDWLGRWKEKFKEVFN